MSQERVSRVRQRLAARRRYRAMLAEGVEVFRAFVKTEAARTDNAALEERNRLLTRWLNLQRLLCQSRPPSWTVTTNAEKMMGILRWDTTTKTGEANNS